MLISFPSKLRQFCLKQKYFRLYCKTYMPEFDIDYYCKRSNEIKIKNNILSRKGIGNIQNVLKLFEVFKTAVRGDQNYEMLKKQLYSELAMLPNKTHPLVQEYKEPRLIHALGNKKDFSYEPVEFSLITNKIISIGDKLTIACGSGSYCLTGELAELEEALIKYAVVVLLNKNFQLHSVPDIVSREALTSCGMDINDVQIYSLDPEHYGPDLHLSGTSEIALANLLRNSTYDIKQLPLKLCAVSRCYRAEIANTTGIYRVHQFTKVEMFVVTPPEQSDKMLEELREIQEELFTPLGLHMRVLDMSPDELGASAYRKYDIEAWMPGRKGYGEISSTTNCTDYQSRRLNIKCQDGSNVCYAHTLNGTACAIPRMLTALIETHQSASGRIEIPEVLRPYMQGKTKISSYIPKLDTIHKKQNNMKEKRRKNIEKVKK